jgi:hypothetical protein
MEPQEKNNQEQEELVFEDLVNYGNDYTYGATSAGRNAGANKLTVLDLLRMNADDNSDAPNILPHQMSTFVDNLGDIYIKIVEVQQMVSQAYKSSITKDTKKIKKGLVEINKNLQKQKKLIKDCGKLIDKLSH